MKAMILAALALPVRVLRALGAKHLVLTNAAGSLRAEVGPGRIMADHRSPQFCRPQSLDRAE